jgi:hypothetical protein
VLLVGACVWAAKGVALCGPLDRRAQADLPWVLRSDTPTHLPCNVIEAQATLAEDYFPATGEQTHAASGVYISSMMWTIPPSTSVFCFIALSAN